MTRILLLFISVLTAGFVTSAQTDRSYLQKTNTEALKKMASEFREQNQEEMKRARAIAQKRNIPMRRVTADGNVITVSGVNAYGLLEFTISQNLDAAKTTRTDDLWYQGSLGLNLAGKGYTIGEWDGGKVYQKHQDLTGRVTQKDNASTISDHATHVAGTLVGSDSNNQARGMAYKADLNAYDWSSDNSEMSTAAGGGLLVSNHSYGAISGWRYKDKDSSWYWYGTPSVSPKEDWRFGFYTSDARNWDQIANQAPYYLIVKSAGNERNDDGPSGSTQHFVRNSQNNWVKSSKTRYKDGSFDCVSGKSTAKNIMTVGAVNDLTGSYNGPGAVSMTSFSSWGPTDDGRIKPDIVANGRFLKSCGTDNPSDYSRKNGTSMSAPNAAGSMLLLQEHYFNLNNKQMRAATLKSLVIHTAEEAGVAQGPDYKYGWGLMNTKKAAQHINDSSGGDFMLEKQLQNQDTFTFTVNASPQKELSATLSWNDPAAQSPSKQVDPTTKMLVNDLNLRIRKKNGSKVYKPYVLDTTQLNAGAQRGDNSRDNVEQVVVQQPKTSTYVVEVTHDGTLKNQNPQAFSLIISAAGKGCQAPAGLTVDSLNSQNSWLKWTSFSSACSSSATKWKVQWGQKGFNLGSGDSMAVSQTNAQLSGLSPNTTYQAYVAEIRSNNTRTRYVGPVEFTTPPAPVSLPYNQGFESFSNAYTKSGAFTGSKSDLWLFYSSIDKGRLRFSGSAVEASQGNKAATLDVTADQNMAKNNLLLNLNMTNYTNQEAIFLSFDHREYGEEDHANDSLWIRGAPTKEWIGLYDLEDNSSQQYEKAGPFNISRILRQNGQTFSKQFQVRFGQQDNYTLGGRLNDGRSFDNVVISKRDMAVKEIIQPANYCGLTSKETLKISVKNTGFSTISTNSSVEVSYEVNNNMAPAESLNLQQPLKPGDTVHHTFQNQLDLAVGNGPYNLQIGLNYAKDQVANNDTIQRSVTPLPGPSVSYKHTNACEGQQVQFQEQVDPKGGKVTAYNWSFGNGKTAKGPKVKQAFAQSGIFNISLSIETQNQCNKAFDSTIKVDPTPKADFKVINNCGLDSVQFQSTSSANGATLQSYQWQFANNQSDSKATAYHSYANQQMDTVKLTVKSMQGCEDTVNNLVPVAKYPTADFKVNKSCVGSPLQLTNNSSIGGNASLAYDWELGRGRQSRLATPSPVFDSSGNVAMTLTAINKLNALQCKDKRSQQIEIHESVPADFQKVSDQAGSITLRPNDQSADQYQWELENGETRNETEPTISFDSNASFTVKLITTTGEGCKDTVVQSVEVQTVGLPVGDSKPSSFRVYPNPAELDQNLSIEYNLTYSQEVKLVLFNQQGQQLKILKQGLKEPGSHQVQFTASKAISPGTYILKMISNEKTGIRRLILVK